MNLARWEPFQDLLTLQDRMNGIHEEPERIVLRAELPGVGRDDIDVSVEKGTLTLCGEKKFEKEVDAESAYRQERFYGSFTRSFVLPTAIDPDRIQAGYKDGVLEVVLPKVRTAS